MPQDGLLKEGVPLPEGVAKAIVWVDATPFLVAARAKLRATQKKLSLAEERVRLHTQSDEPDYQRWFTATFSERLAELRELYEKLARLDDIAWKVEREILATGCSAAEAYAAVMEEIEAQERGDSDGACGFGADSGDGCGADGRGAGDANGDGGSSDGRGANDGHGTGGDHEANGADSGDGRGSAGSRGWGDTWSATSKAKGGDADDEIKQIYRQLVRRLHPDLNPDLSESLRERWFEVQQAYDDRDLTRLEKLLALCEEGGDEGTFIDRIQSLSRLKTLLKSVAKKLKSSQRQLTQLKRAPAWDFHKTKRDPRRLDLLKRDVRYELRKTEEALSGDIRTIEAQIEKWQAPAPRRNKRDWNLSFEY